MRVRRQDIKSYTDLPLLGIKGQKFLRFLLVANTEIVLPSIVFSVKGGKTLALSLKMFIERGERVRMVQRKTQVVNVGRSNGKKSPMARRVGS